MNFDTQIKLTQQSINLIHETITQFKTQNPKIPKFKKLKHISTKTNNTHIELINKKIHNPEIKPEKDLKFKH